MSDRLTKGKRGLAARIKVHEQGPKSREMKVTNRWSEGGFKRPGSQNPHKG